MNLPMSLAMNRHDSSPIQNLNFRSHTFGLVNNLLAIGWAMDSHCGFHTNNVHCIELYRIHWMVFIGWCLMNIVKYHLPNTVHWILPKIIRWILPIKYPPMNIIQWISSEYPPLHALSIAFLLFRASEFPKDFSECSLNARWHLNADLANLNRDGFINKLFRCLYRAPFKLLLNSLIESANSHHSAFRCGDFLLSFGLPERKTPNSALSNETVSSEIFNVFVQSSFEISPMW